MEWCSKSNPRKKFKRDAADAEKSSINVPRKSLLYIFIEYVWDERDGQLSGREDVELRNWITSSRMNVFSISFFIRQLEIRNALRIQSADNLIFRDNLVVRNTRRQSNNQIKWEELAYKLRKVLPLLVSFNINHTDNIINHTDAHDQTILHVFLKGHLETAEYLSELQLSRMRSLIKKLITRGASLYVFDKHNKSPIHIAALCENPQILDLIVSCLTDADARDANGNAALHIVLANCVDELDMEHKDGYVDIVRALVSKGADLDAQNNKGESALHLAAEKFHVKVLKFLADSGADFRLRACQGETPLHYACKSSLKLEDATIMVEAIELLVGLAAGCDIEAVDEKGFTPLHYAAKFATVEIVERLLKLGASVDRFTKDVLMTPLHVAAKCDRLQVMKRLVAAGADVNAEAADGATPIFMSAAVGSLKSMLYLTDQGADLYRRDKLCGFTLLHMATYRVEHTSGYIRNLAISDERRNEKAEVKFSFLIGKAGLDVDDPGTCGMTPLHLATMWFNVDAVKALIEHNADVNFQSQKSQLSALHLASAIGCSEIAGLLIEAGAAVNCRGGIGQWTPLHLVLANDANRELLDKYLENVTLLCFKTSALANARPKFFVGQNFSCFDITSFLINKGADVNVKDSTGKSPLHLATLKVRNSFKAKILLESGARANVQDHEGRLPVTNVLRNRQLLPFKDLLDFGADINDHDVSRQIVELSSGDLKIMALQHVIKLEVLGLPIAKIYESSIDQLKFMDFYTQCLREVDALRKHSIDDCNFSLYQFMRMGAKRQYHFVEKISSSYESLKGLYPLYFGIIRGACREAVYRRSLLKLARIAWSQLSKVYLPAVCIEHILAHLNNRYLEVLVFSAKSDSDQVSAEATINACIE